MMPKKDLPNPNSREYKRERNEHMKKLYEHMYNITDIAKKYGISKQRVWAICAGTVRKGDKSKHLK